VVYFRANTTKKTKHFLLGRGQSISGVARLFYFGEQAEENTIRGNRGENTLVPIALILRNFEFLFEGKGVGKPKTERANSMSTGSLHS